MTEQPPRDPEIQELRDDINNLSDKVSDLSDKITKLEGELNTQRAELDGDIRELRADIGGRISTLRIILLSVVLPAVVALATALIVRAL